MAQFFSQYGPLLAEGVWESVYMTLATTALAYVLGLPMGVLLTVTKRGGIAAAPAFSRGVRLGGKHSAQPAVPDFDVFCHYPSRALWQAPALAPRRRLCRLPSRSASPFMRPHGRAKPGRNRRRRGGGRRMHGRNQMANCRRALLLVESVPSPAARAFHQRYHHFGLHRHHRCVRRRGPWQPGLPLWLPALSEGRDVCVHPSSYFAGVRHSNYLRPCGPQSG